MNAGELFNNDDIFNTNPIKEQLNVNNEYLQQMKRLKDEHQINPIAKDVGNWIDKKTNILFKLYNKMEDFYYNKYEGRIKELEHQRNDLKNMADEYKNEKELFETNPIVAAQLRTEKYNASEQAKARIWQQTMYGKRFQDAIQDIKKAGLNPYILNNFSPASGFTGGAAHIMSNVQHNFSNIKSTSKNTNYSYSKSKNYNYNENKKVWNPMDIAQAILSGFAGIIGGAGSLIGGLGKMK